MPCLTRDHTGNHRYGSGGHGSWGQCGQEPLLWFLHGGTGEAACMGFRLVSLNNLSGFRGTGPFSSCLVPTPESDEGRYHVWSIPALRTLNKGGGCGVGSGFVGCFGKVPMWASYLVSLGIG